MAKRTNNVVSNGSKKEKGVNPNMRSIEEYAAAIRETRSAASPDAVRDGRAWYPGMTAIMNSHAAETGLTPRECAAVYAACSINTKWDRNVFLASGALTAYAAGDEAFATGGTLIMHIEKVFGILTGADIDSTLAADPLSYKVISFTHNLAGDYQHVTVDRWAVRDATRWADCEFHGTAPCARNKATGTLTGRGHGCSYVPKGEEYQRIADAYRIVAAEFGENPADTQAINWCVIRGTGE